MEKGRYEISELANDGKEVAALVNRMAGIIDHMRSFTRKAEGSPLVDVDVNARIVNALGLIQEQLRTQGIQVERELLGGPLVTLAVPNNIEQVFLNLLTNARDAVVNRMSDNTYHEGRIVIRSFFFSDEELCVAVQDNGGGIRTAIRDRIFDPFFTTKEEGKGTGLGLSITQRIVIECSGRIELDVEEGEGTTVRVILPVSASRSEGR